MNLKKVVNSTTIRSIYHAVTLYFHFKKYFSQTEYEEFPLIANLLKSCFSFTEDELEDPQPSHWWCCLYYFPKSKLVFEAVLLFFRLLICALVYCYILNHISCNPFYTMYLVADPIVSIMLQFINMSQSHAIEKDLRELGLKVVRFR